MTMQEFSKQNYDIIVGEFTDWALEIAKIHCKLFLHVKGYPTFIEGFDEDAVSYSYSVQSMYSESQTANFDPKYLSMTLDEVQNEMMSEYKKLCLKMNMKQIKNRMWNDIKKDFNELSVYNKMKKKFEKR